jgi:predicted kinase
VAERGVSVVLDAGLWHRERRMALSRRLECRGIPTRLHYCDVPDAELWRRLELRNRALPPGTYEITSEMFETFRACFEPPGEDEPHEVVPVASAPGADSS